MTPNPIKDPVRDSRLIRRRIIAATVIVCLAMGLLGARVAWLQVAGYQHYTTQSQQNRIRLVALPPTRGLIRDRNGVVLAENVTAHGLVITPEQVPDLEDALTRLGDIIEIRPTDLERFWELYERQRRFQEIPLRLELNERELARLSVNRHRFPGVEITSRLIRHYPHGEKASHVVGYVGRISERELRAIEPGEYQGSSHIGKTGIERFYEERLRGRVGLEKVETNALGRVIRSLERSPPVPGDDIRLTIDLDLQSVAEQALGDFSGAIVALDPRNGEVLAFASQPTFDPNLFVTGITVADYAALQDRRDRPLFNRALRGQYPPGSTFKPFVALAGLAHDVRQPEDSIMCNGVYTLPDVNHRWRDWKRWGHGEVALEQAMAQSCDIYFYDLAYNLGIDAIHEFLGPFGFGQRTGIDLRGEMAGVLPSREWKRQHRGEPWYHGETVITGIGQGFTLTTPLQLAYATAILANDGQRVRPHLLINADGAEASENGDDAASWALTPVAMDDPDHWNEITASMVETVHGRRGTARAIGDGAPYRMAGKTGTAQVFGLAQDEEYDEDEIPEELHDHALFIAFAPAEAPEIAVAVIAENGGSGSGTAAPMARAVMDAWLGHGETDDVDVSVEPDLERP